MTNESESGNPDRVFACGMERKRRSLWGLESRARQGRLADRPDGAGSPGQSFVYTSQNTGALIANIASEKLSLVS